MPYYSTPGGTGRSIKEALDALMAQGGAEQSDHSPIALPPVPPAPIHGAGPQAPKPPSPFDRSTPPYGSSDQSMVMGDSMDIPDSPGPSPFAAVTRQNAMQGLQGFASRQDEQFSPFGEMELSRLASRDPRSVAPGSNQMWAGRLQEMQQNRQRSEDTQRKALEGIQGAIAGTHPAVQFQQEQAARRAAMPETIRAQGAFRAAQETANSRRYAADAAADSSYSGREFTSKAGMADTVMQAIRAIHAKDILTSEDRVRLRALQELYDLASEDLNGATFGEATEGLPQE